MTPRYHISKREREILSAAVRKSAGQPEPKRRRRGKGNKGTQPPGLDASDSSQEPRSGDRTSQSDREARLGVESASREAASHAVSGAFCDCRVRPCRHSRGAAPLMSGLLGGGRVAAGPGGEPLPGDSGGLRPGVSLSPPPGWPPGRLIAGDGF